MPYKGKSRWPFSSIFKILFQKSLARALRLNNVKRYNGFCSGTEICCVPMKPSPFWNFSQKYSTARRPNSPKSPVFHLRQLGSPKKLSSAVWLLLAFRYCGSLCTRYGHWPPACPFIDCVRRGRLPMKLCTSALSNHYSQRQLAVSIPHSRLTSQP